MDDLHSPIAARAVRFAGYLRALNFDVAPVQTLDFVHSLAWIDLTDPTCVRAAARAVFVRRHDEIAVFEAAFDRFWTSAMLDPRAKRGILDDERTEAVWKVEPFGVSDLTEPREAVRNRTQAYSAAEHLRRRDFGALDDHEVAAVRAAIRALAAQLPARRSRRLQPSGHGRQLDLRTTLRASVRTGGDPLRLARRSRKIKPRPLVVLCDVSGSMERYARILLQFAYALANPLHGEAHKVEAFVFATALTRVTPYLRDHAGRGGREAQDAQRLAAAVRAARDWGGGTRIGASLRALHAQWDTFLVGTGPVVLIISDGCDRGEIPLLASQLGRLRRRSHRLIWLNPWLGQEGYTPAVRGMQAALPHVDLFLPIHNLNALEQLVTILGGLRA